jgi:hypothetical protein
VDLLFVRDPRSAARAPSFSPIPNIYNNLGNLLFAQRTTQVAPTDAVRTQFWHGYEADAHISGSRASGNSATAQEKQAVFLSVTFLKMSKTPGACFLQYLV